jgi:hypothetical protein
VGFVALLEWVGVTDLDNLDHASGLIMVREAVEELQGQDDLSRQQILQELQPIYDDLLQGGLPIQSLQDFFQRHQGLLARPSQPVGALLEEELRSLAGGLCESEWCTPAYLNVEKAVDAFLEGDAGLLESTLSEMETVLDQAWEPYSQTPIAESEITAESVVGDRLLREGIKEWFQAVECLRALASEDSLESDRDWDEALATAEYANRLLVAVQRFSRRLEDLP